MRRVLSLALLLTLACATAKSTRPETIAQPDLDARLANPLYFGSSAEAAATIEVGVRNRATVPIIVRRIEVAAPSMRQYTLIRTARVFRETIPPGQTKVLTVFTSAVAQLTNRPDEPLSLQVIVDLESEGHRWREILQKRSAG